MARGAHVNSRANLAGAGGGDRYAGKRATIAAIRNALETIEDGGEIRAFFGLRPGQLLKQKHRARWAKVKSPEVYAALVRGAADAVLNDAGGFRCAGFIDRAELTSGRGRLYPVAVGGGPLAVNELQHRRVELIPRAGNYDGAPFSGVIDPGGFHGDGLDEAGISPPKWWIVYVQSMADVVTTFDDGHTVSSSVNLAPAGILVWGVAIGEQYIPPGWSVPVWRSRLEITEPDKDMEDGGIFISPAGWLLTPAEWRRRARPVMVDWRAWDWIDPSGVPAVSHGYPMPVENWAENFPQVRAAADSVRLGVQNRAGVEWITGGDWMQRFGGARASYLSAGCVVPPLPLPVAKKRVAVTFSADFVAGIQPGPAPEGPAP